MTQIYLEYLWRLNRLIIGRGWHVPFVGANGDSEVEVITVHKRTWKRDTGTIRWFPMKPLRGNLRT